MANPFELDHAYLRQTISTLLTEALAQLAVLQPDDPVDYLGNYLLKHVVNVEAQQQLQKRVEKQQQFLATSQQPTLSNDDQEQQWKINQEEETQLQSQLQNAPSVALTFERFLEYLCSSLNAKEAYIGRKCTDLQGNNVVHFIASSRGLASTILDKIVTQSVDDENAHGSIGVTFDAFKEDQSVRNDDIDTDVDNKSLAPAFPKFVLVANVLRESRVKFFGVPKLGALLLRAGQYQSYLHADVYNESNLEEPLALEQYLVFYVDTVGQARTFTTKEINHFYDTTERFLTTLEDKECQLYMADNQKRLSDDANGSREFFANFSAQMATQEESLASQLPVSPEDEELSEGVQQLRVAKETDRRLAYLTTMLVSHLPNLARAATRIVPFKDPVLSVFAAALELLGYSRRELHNPATGRPSWDKLAPLLEETELGARLNAFEMSLTRIESLVKLEGTSAKGLSDIRKALPVTADVVSQVKQTLAAISKEEVDSESPIASCFFVWVLAVIARAEHLTAMADQAQQQEEEAAAAAAAAASEDDV